MSARLTFGILALFWQKPYALLPFGPLFWAINLLIGRAYASQLPPFGLTFWRWVVASLCMLPFVWRELLAKRRDIFAHLPLIVAVSVSGFAGYPILNYFALHTTPAATAAVLNSALPLMVPLLAWLIAGDLPSPRMLLGIIISFAGVVVIVCRGELAVLTSLSFGAGECEVLLAVAGYALYSVLLRHRPQTLSGMALLATMSLTTAAILLPFWIGESLFGRLMPTQPYAIASVLFIGIFASLIGAAFWNRCVAVLGPTLTGASFHLMAIYSSALAFLLLGEPIRTFHVGGIALILVGFAVAVVPLRPARTSYAPGRAAAANEASLSQRQR
jgi:drug/metabolite transporter (DMT)-like permease